MPDFHDWPTKSEAADALHCSIREIERLVKAGKIRVHYRETPGRRPLTVHHPEDISRLADERRAAQQQVLIEPARPPAIHEGPSVGAALLAALQQPAKPCVPIAQKLYLTLPEAVEYSGRTHSYLLRAIKSRELRAVKDGGWRIARAALERL
jgi:hypothetical protein